MKTKTEQILAVGAVIAGCYILYKMVQGVEGGISELVTTPGKLADSFKSATTDLFNLPGKIVADVTSKIPSLSGVSSSVGGIASDVGNGMTQTIVAGDTEWQRVQESIGGVGQWFYDMFGSPEKNYPTAGGDTPDQSHGIIGLTPDDQDFIEDWYGRGGQ